MNTMPEKQAPEAAKNQDQQRKPYVRPELQKHGNVESLTQVPVGSVSQPLQFT